ncbi:biotin-independent malonate decarboxylase subunit gamma [Streptomyces hygroscopicus]|uniref:biotin-independent malonate decarboxylase subunit gamma n=1 Tax=Streptomyces hygroscopicus TaxID=1912 RepID=UPI0022408BF7|nr:biotin-independent malonate decarboxylase subunit gamma [Streptomyces hygroscopicus]
MIQASQGRAAVWFEALTGTKPEESAFPGRPGPVRSLAVADAPLLGRPARFLAVVPDPASRWPRARLGEVGLDEGWALAAAVREAVAADAHAGVKRAVVAVVDVPSQAYGHREELLGLHQALAGAVDAYSAARLAGHPVIAFVVGRAISGAFLAHGLQAHRIVALDDPDVMVQVMSKESAARITHRTVAELDAVARSVPATAYDGATFATLGAVHRLVAVQSADEPTPEDARTVEAVLADAVTAALNGHGDLSDRLRAPGAARRRAASVEVRRRLAATWHARS